MTEDAFPEEKCIYCNTPLTYRKLFNVDNGESEVFACICEKCDKLIYYAKKEKLC